VADRERRGDRERSGDDQLSSAVAKRKRQSRKDAADQGRGGHDEGEPEIPTLLREILARSHTDGRRDGEPERASEDPRSGVRAGNDEAGDDTQWWEQVRHHSFSVVGLSS
jgi:hypothetical protein